MYNPYQPIGPDNQPDNTVQTGWTRVETASADNPQSESPAPPPGRLCSLGRGPRNRRRPVRSPAATAAKALLPP